MRGHKCDCCSLVPFANFLQCSSLAWCGFLYGKFPVGVEKKWAPVLGTNLWECIWGFMEVSAKEKRTITKNRLFVKVLFWSCLSHVEGYVGLRLGNWRSKLGPCGVPWRSLVWKNQPQPKTFRLRFILGALGGHWRAMSDHCWAVLGLCWAHVGSCWVIWWALWVPRRSMMVYVGCMLGLCWGHVGAVL